MRRSVMLLGYPGVQSLDVVGPFEVFATASLVLGGGTAGYDVTLVSAGAARCGFGTAETMRRNFVRRIGISPDQYRKSFA